MLYTQINIRQYLAVCQVLKQKYIQQTVDSLLTHYSPTEDSFARGGMTYILSDKTLWELSK